MATRHLLALESFRVVCAGAPPLDGPKMSPLAVTPTTLRCSVGHNCDDRRYSRLVSFPHFDFLDAAHGRFRDPDGPRTPSLSDKSSASVVSRVNTTTGDCESLDTAGDTSAFFLLGESLDPAEVFGALERVTRD
jgi:hypothetical protein